MKTTVAFLVFNRPDTTETVFETIRQAKPPKLLVVADGPRANRVGEAEKCAAVRNITERVDWECEVIRNYSDVNLGCKRRVSSGLDWVFNTVEEAIILEDDCLPHPSFFRFCDELLDRYRHDERIMMISGTNYLGEWKSHIQSYHFSYYGGIWGWASWQRAWKYYDVNMYLWKHKEVKDRIRDILANDYQYRLREKLFEATFLNQINTWDYQWSFARLLQSGLSVVPCTNLVSNLGFREDATHTNSNNSALSKLRTLELKFPIRHSDFTAIDRLYDQKMIARLNPPKNIFAKAKGKTKQIFKKILPS